LLLVVQLVILERMYVLGVVFRLVIVVVGWCAHKIAQSHGIKGLAVPLSCSCNAMLRLWRRALEPWRDLFGHLGSKLSRALLRVIVDPLGECLSTSRPRPSFG
jgi:hypothetical protein